ncbi:hypothetical protein WG66_010000 [Moniliophthora roreri]|nr:hypothetical protein WG66_010000 [Moniliophthora roreri]
MSERGRSASPKPIQDADIDMDLRDEKPDAKVIIVTNLTRNVVETHLRTIFGFYGQITKIDLPVFGKSGQNRGKAALEFEAPAMAHKAASHMNGGQLDGAVLKVELSDLPVEALGEGRVEGLVAEEEISVVVEAGRDRGPRFVEELGQEDVPRATLVGGMVACVDPGRARDRIQCVRAVLVHSPVPVPVLGRGHYPTPLDPTRGTVEAGAGRLAREEGVGPEV